MFNVQISIEDVDLEVSVHVESTIRSEELIIETVEFDKVTLSDSDVDVDISGLFQDEYMHGMITRKICEALQDEHIKSIENSFD